MSHLDHPSIHESLARLREEELARKARHHHPAPVEPRAGLLQSRAVSLLLGRAGALERRVAHTARLGVTR